MKKYVITSEEFAQVYIDPSFQDLVPTMPYNSTLFDWTPYDLKGKTSTQIINLRRTGNILQRRDASCDLNYKNFMGTALRKMTIDEVYAATRHCPHSFYQGALKDFRKNDPLFEKNIEPFFRSAISTDLLSNGYFGSLNRVQSPTSVYNTTTYKGVLEWLKDYQAAGVLPANQAFTISNVDLRQNPATALAVLDNAYNKQNLLMRNMAPADKAFYVSQNIVDGLENYYRSLGQTTPNLVAQYQNGVKVYAHNNVIILVEPLFEPILAELSGNPNAALCILTLRGNFSYGYDSLYGEGENLDEAFRLWYDDKELSWYYQMFLKAGTQVALPEHVVYGITAF